MVTKATRITTGAPERQEDLYADHEQIFLRIHRKNNSHRPDQPWEVFLKKHFRKPIEGVFGQITDLFPRHIHGVTAKGFLLKVFLFLLAYTFDGLTPHTL